MSDDWALAEWDGATVHGDPRDRIANQMPLPAPPPKPDDVDGEREGRCGRCGLSFADDNDTAHECPPGFRS